MNKKMLVIAAFATAMLPLLQPSAQARHLHYYAPTWPAVVAPVYPTWTVAHPAYPAYGYYTHHYWRHYPHYEVEFHHHH